jgi:transcriptional regulator with GAF, ATPase, and Fis domain
MAASTGVSSSSRTPATRGALWRIAIAVGLLANLAALAVGLFSLFEAQGRVWTGLALFENGVVGPRILTSPQSYPSLRRVVPGTRIVSVNGQTIEDPAQISQILADIPTGAPVEHIFRTSDGTRLGISLPVSRFSIDDALGIFVTPMIAGLLFLLAATIPLFAQPREPVTLPLALVGIGLTANYIFLLPDYFLGQRIAPLSFIFPALGVTALMHLGLMFPEPRAPLKNYPRATLGLLYGSAAVFWGSFAAVFASGSELVIAYESTIAAFLVASLIVLSSNVLRASLQDKDQSSRRAGRLVGPSIALFLVVAVIIAAGTWGASNAYFRPSLYFLPVPALAIALALGMLSQDFLRLDRTHRRLLARGFLLIAALSMFFLLVMMLEFAVRPTTAWIIAAAATLLTTSTLPLVTSFYARVDDWIEGVLFPQQKLFRQSLEAVATEVGRLRDSNALVVFLRKELAPLLANAPISLIRGSSDAPLEEVSPQPGTLKVMLPTSDPLRVALSKPRGIERGRPRDRDAITRATELGAELIIPFPESGDWMGALLVGPRGDGEPHHEDDVRLLYSLAGTTAVAVENALRMDQVTTLQERLESENLYLRAEVDQEFAGVEIIGRNAAIREALSQIQRVAATDVSVLIVGETGTGKELAVRTLHAASDRADRPLIKLACAALPEHLLESELFGHERGAFTGADRAREGRFETADGGTLFFDDVDTLGLGVQAKLLRALQEGEVQRLGSNSVRKVDVRVVAATNRDLGQEVRAGRFREDLFYRLAVVPIRLPPLRERLDDLELLVEHLARTQGKRLGREIEQISSDAILEMRKHRWPGNVRELRNVIERAIVLESGPVLRLTAPLTTANEDESKAVGDATQVEPLARGKLGSEPMAALLSSYKRALIEEALRRSDGNQRQAAELLGMHRQSLTRMIKDLGIGTD